MSNKPQATSTAAAPPASAEPAGLPAALLALLPPASDAPYRRVTRWDHEQGCPVWIDATRRGRPLIPESVRDLFGEFGVPDVARELEPLSRNTALAIAAEAPGVQPWSWILCGQKMAGAYRLQANADAKAAANGTPKP